MPIMLNLRLPEDIENRLDMLSLGSGHTRQFYVLEALLEYLDEVEARQRCREAVREAPLEDPD
jgi:predicted DNA-binding protein